MDPSICLTIHLRLWSQYFDATPFAEDEFGTWTKDGDLLVTVGAKSG